MSDRARLDRCTVHVSKSLLDAMKALEDGVARIAVVVNDGSRLVGLLTDGNVRRAILGGASLNSPLEPYVTRQFVSVPPTAGRTEVLELMRARYIEQIPIVDANHRLVGLHLLHEVLGATQRPNWAVILAGGKGTRLRPLTDSVPKPMLKVAGRPILERIILHLVGFGIRKIFLGVNYLAEVIQDHFRSGERFGCQIEYLVEDKPLGTAGCLSLMKEMPSEPFLVLNGDLVTQFDARNMLEHHEQNDLAITVGTREHQYTVPFGVIHSQSGLLEAIHEKPGFSWQTNAGIYVVSPDLCSSLPRGEFLDMPSLINDCLERKQRVGVYPIEEDWIDVGHVRELNRARGEHE